MPSDFTCKACGHMHADTIGSKDAFTLLRCAHCGTVTIKPFPSIAELIAFYEAYKGTTDYTKKEKSKIRRSRARIKRLMRLARGARFLDVGCNYGFAVAAAHDLGLDAHGIDVDSAAIASNQKRYADKGSFTYCSVEDYAASGAKADMIYTSEVIEHVPDPNSFVASMAKILTDGGVLYLTTPDASHWRVPKTFAQWDQVIPPEHVTYFTRKGMQELLSKHGFKTIRFGFNLKPGLRVIASK
jgi:2-polyprenyl-3-methyl-5-hydroxy-6-metoxy-1,4-benzoquinol methylase